MPIKLKSLTDHQTSLVLHLISHTETWPLVDYTSPVMSAVSEELLWLLLKYKLVFFQNQASVSTTVYQYIQNEHYWTQPGSTFWT